MGTNLVIDAKLSKLSYSFKNGTNLPDIDIDGWRPVYVPGFEPGSTNFAALLFVGPDGSYKIAYRGTANLLSSGDTTTNVQSIVLNKWTQELTDSIEFTHAAIRYIAEIKGISYGEARGYLSLTGHSQGGFESEVNAKFFGLPGTSLDGPGASAITQLQEFIDYKDRLSTAESQLEFDYPIGEFVARRYTFIVGALNRHVDGVTADNSIASLTLSALTTLSNPLVGVGVQAQLLHRIDNIIDTETARANNRLWNILGQNEPLDTTVAQIGSFMYPTYLANADGSVSVVTPDPVVMEQIRGFLADQADQNVSIYAKDGATYIEGSGGSLLIRSDGSGERWITSSNSVTQEILGTGSIIANRVETRVLDNQTITETSRYDSTVGGLVQERRIVQIVNSDATVTREVFDGNNELVVTSTAAQRVDGSVLFTDVYPDGREITRVEDTLLSFTSQSLNGAQTLYNAIKQGTFSDALSLIRAIQSGEPLPIVASGLRMAADFSSLSGVVDRNLVVTSSFVSSTLSLLNLMNALEEGDTLTAITAGAQAFSFGAQLYSDFALNTAMEAVDAGAMNLAAESAALESGAWASNIGQSLPYLNLINGLESGDQIGVAAAVIDMVMTSNAVAMYSVPYVGQVYAAYNIISSLFGGDDDPPPEPWGGAAASWSGFSVVANAYGEHGGTDTARSSMTNFIDYLNQLAAYEQSVNPGAAIGVVANRLPSISYRHYSGFELTDIDPLTGVQNYPGIKYDFTGHPYNAPAGSEPAGQTFGERFVHVALARGAIAPMWEVETAAIQTQYGDPKAGLTEEERAGRNGQLAGPLTGATQTFRPVALDLDGDGIETTGATRSVAFDVDDSGFLKNTEWRTTRTVTATSKRCRACARRARPCIGSRAANRPAASYRFLALEKTVQEIAEKKRTNQPLVPEKKAQPEEQVSQ